MQKKRNIFDWILFGLEKFGEAICNFWDWVKGNKRLAFELRKVIMAIPVILVALYLAAEAANRLPDLVSIAYIDLRTLPVFTLAEVAFPREVAVSVPLTLTFVSLIPVLFSRRTIYPWIISIFTLVLPVFLILSNIFPA